MKKMELQKQEQKETEKKDEVNSPIKIGEGVIEDNEAYNIQVDENEIDAMAEQKAI